MAKVGIIVTPYKYMTGLERKRKKDRIMNLQERVKKHGSKSGYVTGDFIEFFTRISDESGDSIALNLVVDTGSNITVISPRAASSFKTAEGIPALGSFVNRKTNVFLGSIEIENEIIIEQHEIHVIDLEVFNSKIDGVIGMDIIQAGDLHIYQKDGFPYFEFSL